MNLQIVIVDDDAVILFLHKILIQKSSLPSAVKAFANPLEALDYVQQKSTENHVLLFLDINMPLLSGWEFLDRLQNYTYTQNIYVVMVTSSINFNDREKAEMYKNVIGYEEKPLSKEACENIFYKMASLLN